jgi:hypothetical protein
MRHYAGRVRIHHVSGVNMRDARWIERPEGCPEEGLDEGSIRRDDGNDFVVFLRALSIPDGSYVLRRILSCV